MMTAHQTVDIKNLRIDPLEDPKVLTGFDSGEPEVDRQIDQCCNWHDRYRNRVYCAFLPNRTSAVGFYCLGISAAQSKYLDENIVRSHGAFGYVPFIFLNYIAVSDEYQNNGIGTILLVNSLKRCANTIQNIGIYGVALTALNDRVAGLYDRYGFREYGDKKKYPFMILPAQSVLDLFA